MSSFEMRVFAGQEADTVAHWATNVDEVWRLAAIYDFPLTADTVRSWTFEADYVFTLRREGDLVAYGEIVEDEVDHDVEIQHLIVASDMRNQGIGKAFLSRLCAFLANGRPYPEVWMRVGRDNEAAAACARAIGFAEQSDKSGPRYLWLRKSLERGGQQTDTSST